MNLTCGHTGMQFGDPNAVQLRVLLFADLYANLARGDWHTRQVLANSVGMSDQDAKELMDYMFEEVICFQILALLCFQPLQNTLFGSWHSKRIFHHCGAHS